MTAGLALRSSQFRHEREDSWRALEDILVRADRGSIAGLTPDEIAQLPFLYRAAVSSLSVARTISLDRNMLLYLEGLVARAYVVVYANRRRPRAVLADFFARRFPRLVRSFAAELLVAMLFLGGGIAAGFVLTAADPGRYAMFVSEDRAQGRTITTSTEELKRMLYAENGAELRLEQFAAQLFANNARVGILAAGLGVAAGLPVAFLLLREGLVLGAMLALYSARGLGLDFALWLAPHGVTELLAIALCGAAGLALARALLFPGDVERMRRLSSVGREVTLLVGGAVAMLFEAGLVEGIFRQLVVSREVRAGVALVTLAFWIVYLGGAGRRTAARTDA